MTARNELPPTRYTQCEAYRQAVLNLVHETPGMSGAEIIRHFGWPSGTANSRLANMCAMGEMRRKPIEIVVTDMKGHPKTVKTYAYHALVETTISAETVRCRSEDGARAPKKARVAKMKPKKNKDAVCVDVGKVKSPGHYIQKGGNWKANAEAGGQGAIARRVFVGATEGML